MRAVITKRYTRKLSYNYNSEEFCTEVTKEIEYKDKTEYLAEHEKLAAQVKALTSIDIEKNSVLLRDAADNGDAVITKEHTVGSH